MQSVQFIDNQYLHVISVPPDYYFTTRHACGAQQTNTLHTKGITLLRIIELSFR